MKKPKAQKPPELDIRALVGLEPERKKSGGPPILPVRSPASQPTQNADDPLSRQFATLKTMFEQRKSDDFYANFDYVTQRTLFAMKTRRPSELGDVRIYQPAEMLDTLFAKSATPATIDWSRLD